MTRSAGTAVRVRVPATSANLGPGYDSFGLALDLHDEVVVRATDGGLTVAVAGEGADAVPRDRSHLVVRAMDAAFDRLGARPPGLALDCTNRIPHGRGLGSSAAAVVAGLAAAVAVVGDAGSPLDDDDLLEVGTRLEGHPDNVAACLRGGFTVAWAGGDGPRALRHEPAPGLVAVVAVPADAVSTAHARGLLPERVPHADAAWNVARAALLVTALTTRPDLLLEATGDRLHQAYRARAMPASVDLVATLRSRGVPAVVSGAGPAVLALVPAAEAAATAAAVTAAVRAAGWAAVALHVLAPACDGVTVAPVA